MKKSLFIFALLLGVSLSSQAQKVIDYPTIAGRNTQTVDITRVELLPEETVLHITATNSPTLWVKFTSDTVLKDAYSARTYKLLRCEGYPLDTEHYMPEGRQEFKMYFEPLDEEITRFDFVEGHERGAFRVYGVEVRPDSRPYLSEYNASRLQNAQTSANRGMTFPEFLFHFRDDMSARRVYGEPHYEVRVLPSASENQTIVIPAKSIRELRKGQDLVIQIIER